ncbi:MAG: HD domain-containing protein [Opitutaceae bacterium]|nr:HD domain-containing protein [Opitutaceae bacterium]
MPAPSLRDQLPSELLDVLNAIGDKGHPFLAGGCVRDWLLGLPPKDFDIEVYGCTVETLIKLLASFGKINLVGKSFGVIKLSLSSGTYDFSLPRKESKNGKGHRGFLIEADPHLSQKEASARRDFTFNAILYDPIEETLIDYFEGVQDLKKKILRHTSDAFAEDPLRVLRGFQFAGRFGLKMAPETISLCQSIQSECPTLPRERIWMEWEKWASRATIPSMGLTILLETGWIKHFPEIAQLHDLPQDPEWHPEGDVLTHTGYCLDALAQLSAWKTASLKDRITLMLATLTHDLGKVPTTEFAERRGKKRWISPGHEAAGGPLADDFLQRIGAPLSFQKSIRPLVVNHLYHHSWKEEGPSDASIRRLSRRLAPATINQLCTVMEADRLGRPPLVSSDSAQRTTLLRQKADELALALNAPKPILQGRHLIQKGESPGPSFKSILTAAFEAQLEGSFQDEAGAIKWLCDYLAKNK